MADNRPIGVFDSGLGGLTVVREFIKVLPDEDIIYFGDTGRVPYGTRSRQTIIKYAIQDEAFLLSKGVKLIIAACGTVSAVASHTGNQLPVPFIEVVTHAAKAAVSLTKSGKIGVIGTSATISSGTYTARIKELLPNALVSSNDCPLLVPIVEAGWIDRNDPVTIETARRYLEPLKKSQVDTLILGCTHYPVLSEIIGDIMGDGVTLINIGKVTANAAAEYLDTANIRCDKGKRGNMRFYVSDRTESFSHTASILLGSDIDDQVERVDIENY